MSAFRHYPPQAIVSLNRADVLIKQAEEHERFAATEQSLGETGGRERFWRMAAALRLAAHLVADDPGAVAAYCLTIDRERAVS